MIGEERSERLDKIPAVFRVIVTRRPKYACACGEAVAQVPAPPRLIEGGIPTEALIADVVVSKYANHLPLYRQAQIFSRQGIPLDRSTLASWVGAAAAELQPLSMRPIALNRKNSLFAGHDQGAQNRACLASVIETCKLNSVNPNAWLTDVLTKLVNRWPARRIDELMPWAYAATL